MRQVLREAELPAKEFVPDWIPTLLTGSASQELVDEVTAIMYDFHPAGMRAAAQALGAVDLRPVLPTIAVPTLLLYGDADVRSPVRVGQELHSQIPGSILVVLPGAPHLSNLEQPEEFNTAIRRFLDDVQGRQRVLK
jgi:pimeloyl-ACP methyl ester carboxylesterase